MRNNLIVDPSTLFDEDNTMEEYKQKKKFIATKSVRKTNYKVQKRKNKFKSMLVGAATFLAIFSGMMGPQIISHIESDNVSREAAGDSSSLLVVNDKLVEEIPYEKCPEEFDFSGERVAYIDDTGDIFNHRYVIMQSSKDDPNKYLHANELGEYSELGALYKDSRNGPGLSDDVTIIYGHNLIDNGMLGKLGEYSDKEGYLGNRNGQDLYDEQKEKYGEEGNSFIYADEYGMYKLDVVAAGVYTDLDVINLAGNFKDVYQREAAVQYLLANSDIKTNQVVNENDKLFIFQTCEDGDSNTYEAAGDKENSVKRVYVTCKVTPLVKYKDFPNEISGKTR